MDELNIKLIDKDKEQELLSKKYIKTWMMFEVQAVDKKIADSALKKHIKKLHDETKNFIEINETPAEAIEAPEIFKKQGIKQVFSKVIEITFLAKDMDQLTLIAINYGPSAIEILEPEKITISMREAQNILASIADMIHKFATAGIGGMIINQ